MSGNKKWLAMAAVGVALCACAEEAAPSQYAEECARALGTAQTNGMWRWQWRGEIEAADAVFQKELREVLEAQFPNQYQEALACSGEADQPKMAGLRNVLAQAVRATPTAERISALASARGFVPAVQFDVRGVTLTADADGKRNVGAKVRAYGRSANAADVLRDSLVRIRRLGHRSVVTPENMPVSWYDDARSDAPILESRCQDVAGCFKYSCSYRVRPEPECMWEEKPREIGGPREFDDVDREAVWKLLSRLPSEYTHEDVLKALGRPRMSVLLRCSNCKKRDMRWAYDIRDKNAFGDPLQHVLAFSFDDKGRCTGWYWEAA